VSHSKVSRAVSLCAADW